MNCTIWKYTLEPKHIQDIEMPTGAKILTVAMQFDTMCLWAMVDPSQPKMPRRIAVVETGYSVPTDGCFLGTVQTHGGKCVFHIFAEKEAAWPLPIPFVNWPPPPSSWPSPSAPKKRLKSPPLKPS
jgi:hypothetical protein